MFPPGRLGNYMQGIFQLPETACQAVRWHTLNGVIVCTCDTVVALT